MANELIKCPECGAEFPLSQAISHDLEIAIAKKYEKTIKELKDETQKSVESKEKEITERYEKEQKRLEEKSRREKEDALKQLEVERKHIEEYAKKRAKEALDIEIKDLREMLAERDKKLIESQKVELELRRKQRELEEKEKTIELEMMRKVDEERRKILESAQKNFEDQHRLKDAEKDKQLADMCRQIEDLKRKAEQGSQKMQGEVLELELEQLLKNEFLFDDINSVSSGIKGADIIQIVKTQTGRECGKILWETKRAKNWSDEWLQKLKDNQRSAKADLAVIVSETLPKGLHHFRQIETVWVTDIPSAISLGLALRTLLIQINKAREIETGKEEKKEVVYNYLMGIEFRNRVQAIMEAFIAMKKDLDSEKRAMESIWSKRDKQIEKVVLNIAGMRGDLEGIVGASLPSIKLLELPSVNEAD